MENSTEKQSEIGAAFLTTLKKVNETERLAEVAPKETKKEFLLLKEAWEALGEEEKADWNLFLKTMCG
jgi:hypothetical protein